MQPSLVFNWWSPCLTFLILGLLSELLCTQLSMGFFSKNVLLIFTLLVYFLSLILQWTLIEKA